MLSHPAPKNSRQKGNASYIVLGVIVLVIIVVIGIVVATRNGKDDSSDSKSNSGNSSQQPASLLEPKPFASDKYHISFQYPKGWKQINTDTANQVTIEDPAGDTVNGKNYKGRVTYSSYPTKKSSEEYAQSIIDQGQNDASLGIKFVSKDKITVGGTTAYLIRYTTTDPGTGTPLTIDQVVMVKGGTAHIMTGYAGTPAWGTHKDAIDASIKSLKVTS